MDYVYLDYHATSPLDPRVLESMLPYFTKTFANPSGNHVASWQANEACEQARTTLAKIVNCKDEEIYFTASATEANNWLFYIINENYAKPDKNRILFSSIEHPSVLNAINKHCSQCSGEALPVNTNGIIDLNQLEIELQKGSCLLVSIMHGNNEIGSLQDLKSIANLCKKYSVFFHSDAVQTFSKYKIDLQEVPLDFLSWSAHKFYGPKGVGGFFVRNGINISPLIVGGSHERKKRAGTLNVPGILGMAEAANLCHQLCEKESLDILKKTQGLKTGLEQIMQKYDINYQWNNDSSAKLGNNLSLTLKNRELANLQTKLRRICYSMGSACSSKEGALSHVLLAIGLEENDIKNTMRLSTGRMTTLEDIDQALGYFENAFKS